MIGIANDRSLKIIVSKSFSISEIILFQKLSELIKYSEDLCYNLSMTIKKFITELF